MIADILASAIGHPFLSGFLIGGAGFGGSLGIVGFCLGYDHALRKFRSWLKPKVDQMPVEVPSLPPLRDRRAFPTTPGRWA